MVLEINNTKAILLDVLKSGSKSCSELDQAITTFATFCSAVRDHSNDFISQTFECLYEKCSPLLLIECLKSWGVTLYKAKNFGDAQHLFKKADISIFTYFFSGLFSACTSKTSPKSRKVTSQTSQV